MRISLALWVAAWFVIHGQAVAQQPPSQARFAGQVIAVQGRVDIVRQNVTRRAQAKDLLLEGDIIRTGTDGKVALLLADETRPKLDVNSVLVIKQVADRPTQGIVPAALRAVTTGLELLTGQGWFKTADPPQPTQIETPITSNVVRGTEFNIVATADESRLTVLQGQVEMRNALGSVLVQSGELGTARIGEAPRKQVLVNPEDAVQWSLYYPAIFSPRDFPLSTSDRARLAGLLTQAQAESAAAPSDAERQARLGEVLHDLSRRAEARAAFEAALRIDAANGRALNGLGWIALESGDHEQASVRFNAVTPPSAASLLGASLAKYRRGDLPGAAADLDDAVRRFPPVAPVLTQRALFFLLSGDLSRANEYLERALQADGNFAFAHGLRSNIALTQNRKDDALRFAKQAVDADPGSPSAHLDLSLALQAFFQLDTALQAARKAVEIDPNYARARVQVARLLLGFDRIEEAAAEVRIAQSVDPNEPLVLSTLGYVLLAQQRTDHAAEAFQKSIQAGSTSGDPHVGLGLVVFKKGRLEEGLQHFLAATVLEPRVSLFHSYLGKALYQIERRQDGLKVLETASALDPRDPTPELYKGIILTDLNRPAEAIAALQSSVARNDNRAIFRSRLLLDRDLASRNVNLTRSYLALGQNDRAFAAGIRALHEDPQSSAAHLFYGLSLFNQFGDFQRSQSELLQTQILQPVNQNILNNVVRAGTDYTMLIEQPKIQGSLEGGVGNLDSRAASFFVTAARENIAGEQFFNYGRTDGPKPRNSDLRAWSSTTFLKWAPTFRSGLFFEAFHFDQRGGDTFSNARAFTANDPDQRQSAKATRFRLGYQLQPLSESNLLLLAQGQSLHEGLRDRSVQGTFVRSNLTLSSPFYNFQGSYLHRVGAHQLSFTADYFDGEFQDRFDVQPRNNCGAFSLGCFANRSRGRFVGMTLQDVWQIRPDLYLTGALRYDNGHDRIQLTKIQNNSSVFSPQVGLLWRITPDYMIRLAAFRSFQPYPHDTLSPTNIAGFFFDTPSTPSSSSWQYHVAWDADLSPTTFFSAGLFHREVDSPTAITVANRTVRQEIHQHFTGGSLAINQLLGHYFGVSANYLRFHVKQSGVNAGPDGINDLLRLGLFFVHPTGLSAGLGASYLHQDIGSAQVRDAPRNFWLTDVGVSYEFPRKWGTFTVGVNNVSNQKFDLQLDPLGRSVSNVQGLFPVRTYGASLKINF